MFDRKEIKFKGKAAYRANRMTCIIAALLLVIASGAGYGGASAGSNLGNIRNDINNNNSITNDYSDDYFNDYSDDLLDGYSDDAFDDYLNEYDDPDTIPDIIDESPSTSSSWITPAVVAIIVVVVLIAIAIGACIGIFLLNPLQVGVQKFFIDNETDPNTGLNRNTIGLAFTGGNYMKIVGSMFTTGLFTALWTLLLIFPGIYKSYCWRMVPYIVSEDPTISGTDARALSAQMMYGNKWAAFVLDLSFLGWQILGAFTLGILNLVFTNPYQAATNAELYLTLSGRPSEVVYADQPARQQNSSDVIVEFEQDEVSE